MDSVRFGRVLGIGTRLAGKTLAQAVDAATSPNPNPPPTQSAARPDPPSAPVILPPAQRVATHTRQAAQQARNTSQGLARGGKKFGEAVWGPVARASGVLWLEVTGVFFGLIALFGLQGVWSHRDAFHSTAQNQSDHQHLLLAAALAIVFGYFCLSSFQRAARKSRRN